MNASEEQLKFRQFHASLGGQPPGPLAKVVTFLLGAALLVVGFMFSLVALAVVAVGAVLAGTWFWWKTRALRREMREQMRQQQPSGASEQQPFAGRIIEGEVIRDGAPPAPGGHLLN